MSLKAGKLRHVVSIEENDPIVDSSGEKIENWVAVFPRVYASIEPLSARELFAAGAEQSEVVARITIRFRTGLNHAMRIVHRGQCYNIQGLQPDNESGLEWLTIPVSMGLRHEPPIA